MAADVEDVALGDAMLEGHDAGAGAGRWYGMSSAKGLGMSQCSVSVRHRQSLVYRSLYLMRTLPTPVVLRLQADSNLYRGCGVGRGHAGGSRRGSESLVRDQFDHRFLRARTVLAGLAWF